MLCVKIFGDSVVGHFEIAFCSEGFSANFASSSAFSALKKTKQIFNAEITETFAETGEKSQKFKLTHCR